MLYLFLAIFSMCVFMSLLKIFTIKGWNIPLAVLMNYVIAFLIGFLSYTGEISMSALFDNGWWGMAVFSGVLFFFLTDLMAASTRQAGMAVTTIASRTALVVPIIYSILFLHERIGVWEVVGVSLILIALVFIFYQKGDKTSGATAGRDRIKSIILPVLVFMVMGGITICMKGTQHVIKESGNYATDFPLYQVMTFASALISGVVYYAFVIGRKAFRPDVKSAAGGLLVGGFNYLVTLCILLALNVLSTSVFYASYNICVVIITTILSIAVFKEKLTPAKIFGICLSLVAIALLLLFS